MIMIQFCEPKKQATNMNMYSEESKKDVTEQKDKVSCVGNRRKT